MRRHSYWVPAALLLAPAAAFAIGTGAPNVSTGSAAGVEGPAGSRPAPVPSFRKVDTNGDGAIEWSEAKAVGVPRRLFRAEDFHHDGKLTVTEWKMLRVAMVPTRRLPAAGTGPALPQSVVKAMEAPHPASARAPAAASASGGG